MTLPSTFLGCWLHVELDLPGLRTSDGCKKDQHSNRTTATKTLDSCFRWWVQTAHKNCENCVSFPYFNKKAFVVIICYLWRMFLQSSTKFFPVFAGDNKKNQWEGLPDLHVFVQNLSNLTSTGHWAVSEIDCATHAVTRDLGYLCLLRRTFKFSHLLQSKGTETNSLLKAEDYLFMSLFSSPIRGRAQCYVQSLHCNEFGHLHGNKLNNK